jgi:hypothetical protein
MTSIDERYKNALIEEHASYAGAGRAKDAAEVARVLKAQYGHDVSDTSDDPGGDKAPEKADAEKAPENTAEPKPRRTGRPKAASDEKPNG